MGLLARDRALLGYWTAFQAYGLITKSHAGLPASPAYIKDQDQGRTVWRYTMPEGGPEEATPSGNGEGEYKPEQAPKSLVAVVGSAHVRGILREWEKVSHEAYLQQLQEILKAGSKTS